MNLADIWLIFFLVVFALAIVGVGIYSAKKGLKTADDYFVGGRSIGITATLFGAICTMMSGFVFLGMGAFGYVHGMGSFVMPLIGLCSSTTIYFLWRRLWQLARKNKYITQADLLVDRFDSPIFMRLFVSLLGMMAMVVGHFLIQLMACGYIFTIATNNVLPYWFGVVFTAVIALIIVVFGGFRSTAWTGILMGLWIIVSLIVIIVLLLSGLNATIPEAFRTLAQQFPELMSLPGPKGYFTFQVLVSWYLVFGFGFMMTPHMHIRAYSVREETMFLIVAPLFIIASTFISIVPISIGMLARLAWPTLQAAGVPSPDAIIPLVIKKYSSPWLFPLLLAGPLSAIISTVAGVAITISGIVAHDLVKSVNKDLSVEKEIRWGQIVVILAVIIAGLLALGRPKMIVTLLVAATDMVALFIIPIVLGLYWPRLNKQGAIAGLIVGAGVLLHLAYGPTSLGGGYLDKPVFMGFPAGAISIAIQLIVTLVFTYLNPPPPKAIRDKFW